MISTGERKCATRDADVPAYILGDAEAYQDQYPAGSPGRIDPSLLHWSFEPALNLHGIETFDAGTRDSLASGYYERALELGWDDVNAALRDGSIEPIMVVRGDDGLFYPWDGNHRVGTAHLIGVDRLPAYVGIRAR